MSPEAAARVEQARALIETEGLTFTQTAKALGTTKNAIAGLTERHGSSPWPVWVIEEGPPEGNLVSFTVGEDLFGNQWVANHTNGAGGNAYFAFDAGSNRHLVARGDSHFGIGRGTTTRHTNEVQPGGFEQGGLGHGIIGGQAIGMPIGAVDAGAKGNMGGDGGLDGLDHGEGHCHAPSQVTTPLIAAFVGQWRYK